MFPHLFGELLPLRKTLQRLKHNEIAEGARPLSTLGALHTLCKRFPNSGSLSPSGGERSASFIEVSSLGSAVRLSASLGF